MGKKKGARKKGTQKAPASTLDSEDESRYEKWNTADVDFHKDEIDQYLEGKEILPLNNGSDYASCSEKEDSDDEEVLGLETLETDQEESSSNEEEEEDGDGEKEEFGPSDKAWGSKKNTFYNTDYIDDEGEASSDESVAEEEQREALSLQRRMIESLHDDDFVISDLPAVSQLSLNQTNTSTIVPKDLTKLSDDEQLAFIEENWPEFIELTNDLSIKEESFGEMLKYFKNSQKEKFDKLSPKAKLISMLDQLYHLYKLNIVFYLTLQANQASVVDHPVMSRIMELQHMLEQVESSIAIDQLKNTEAVSVAPPRSGILKQKDDLVPKNQKRPAPEDPIEFYERIKKAKKEKRVSFGSDLPQVSKEPEVIEANGKRAITYQIASNKGLNARKKKELRNPRVKHRRKFEKAVTKHRHVVRPVEKELYRYGGEKGGIRLSLARSVKIK
ncbi:PREDICTED: something about silencing protein 10-like [Amphimedon queenslandica]|uniref:Sas10 C-terminal domain-containing protein n=1 Tax=Amphimedon queenslandica TaxID=400682 RepID=A0A1X7UKG2_AMPQE|nr:PREDICTED: something about silencing protein 10-like [Amphimedon queenslandica]|eukprot:XP_003387620.1 PREDICTED: something about silencing protein 10-like [Amphimedon queenslandica]